jgi:hypothetical protein
MIYFIKLIILLSLLLGFKNTFAVEKVYVGFIVYFDCPKESYQLKRYSNLDKVEEVEFMQKLYEGDFIGIKESGCKIDLYVNEKSVQLDYEFDPTYRVEKARESPTILYNAWLQVKEIYEQLIGEPEKIVQGGIKGEKTDPNSIALAIPLLEGYEAELVAGKRTLFLNIVGRNPQEIYLYPENSNNKKKGKINGQQVHFENIDFVAGQKYWVELKDKDTEKKLPFQIISKLPPIFDNSVLNDSEIPPDMKKMLTVLSLLQKADERSIWGLEVYQQLMELKDTNMKVPAEKILKNF